MTEVRSSDIENTLLHVSKVCDRVKKGLVVALVATACFCLIVLCCALINGANPNLVQFDIADGNVLDVVPLIVHCGLVVALLVLGIRVFSSISGGSSPFLASHARTIRQAAYLFLVYALFDLLWSPDIAAWFMIGDASLGYWADGGPVVLHANVGLLISAALFSCLSLLFQYGSLLQQLSDDVV